MFFLALKDFSYSNLRRPKAVLFFILFMLFFCMGHSGFAQAQNNNWVFGLNARVNFNTPTPNGLLSSQMSSNEQCASVSHPTTGNLLFYTDGIKVWNANHIGMPNGNNLQGGPFTSGSQGVMIVPFPENTNKYYIFTLDELEFDSPPLYSGLKYSVVDMTLNGGLGDVDVNFKNVPLYSDSLTEKMTVVRSEEIRGYWVIVHRCNRNEFLSFKISGCDVSAVPVVSAVGTPLIGGPDPNYRLPYFGSIKANPDGNRIGLPIDGSKFIEFFDFNKTTGVLSNPLKVEVTDNTPTTPPTDVRKYGCCFSPDGSKFYFSNTISVFQLNLSAYDSLSIATSCTNVGTPISPFQIEHAPNGKLYVAAAGSNNQLAVISNPNAVGAACGFLAAGLTMSGSCILGLPGRVPERNFPDPPLSFTYDCDARNLNIQVSGISNTSINWNMGVAGGTLTGNPVTFTYPDSGTYLITASLNSECLKFTSDTSVFLNNCACTLSINANSGSILRGDTLQLNATGAATYSWTPSMGLSCTNCANPLAYPETTTTYYVTGTDASGCVAYDTVIVSVDIKCNELFIPDIFTPNGKGPEANEKLCVFSNCVRRFNLIIYNRWGEKVFESNDINTCWDGTFKGKDASSGIYAFKLNVENQNGSVINKMGTVTLLR